jgi:hypothetical protein
MRSPRNFNPSYHRSQNCNHSAPQPYLTLGGVSASDTPHLRPQSSDRHIELLLHMKCPWATLHLVSWCLHIAGSFNYSRVLISFFVNYAENIEPQHHDTRSACSAICTWQWSLSWLEIETMWAPLKCICSAHSRSWVMAPAALFNVLILCADNTSKSDQRLWMPWLRKLHDHGNSRKIGCELSDMSTNLWRWFLYIFMIDLIIMCKYWKKSQSATYCPKGTQPILIAR